MSKSQHNQLKAVQHNEGQAETQPCAGSDVVVLLREAVAHLETTMRLMAEATLLDADLDESLGLEAQSLIGVRDAVQVEIESLERAPQ